MKIVLGVTGASGVIYAVKFLETVKEIDNVEVYLIMSEWAKKNIKVETNYSSNYIEGLAAEVLDNNNLAAQTSSGSFRTDGMVILPCSMKTLGSIANGYCNNLISRTADVMLKERRKLVISPRETPLNSIHLENMLKLAKMGVQIIPPMPAFYNKPGSIDMIIEHHIMKIMDQFGIYISDDRRWNGKNNY